ncbi:hypothetical protein P3W45_001523 [Vairimorpha bombi]|jgi:hypothetical protein
MQKNKNNYKIEPSHKICKSDQMSCNEFTEYLHKYFKKIDHDTFDILKPSRYEDKEKSHPDLLFHLLIGENELNNSEVIGSELVNPKMESDDKCLNLSSLLKKQIHINNKRKSGIMKIIKKKIKYALVFEMLRDIDTEIESIILKRKRSFKKKKKSEEFAVLKELLDRRKLIEDEFVIDSYDDEYEEEEDIDLSLLD